MLSVDVIRTDGGTQSRAEINAATVAEYAEAMADPDTVFPPLIVYHDGRDYWLADGFHRLAAWRQIGRQEVPSEIRQGDQRKAVLHSCGANAAHGLRRSNADKRRAVTTLLEDDEWSQWSDREVARRCGVSHPFVANLRREMLGGREEGGNGYHPDDEGHCDHQEIPSERTNREDGAIGREGHAPDGSSRLSAGRTADPSDTGETVAEAEPDGLSDNPSGDDAAPGGSPAPEPDPYGYARLAADALLEAANGLRADLDEEKAKRKAAEAERDDYKAKWKEATGEDMGRALGNAQRQRDTAKGRLGEEQAKNARQGRRVAVLEAELKALRERFESQSVDL